MRTFTSSLMNRKSNGGMRFILTTFIGLACGFFIGISFPVLSFKMWQLNLPVGLPRSGGCIENKIAVVVPGPAPTQTISGNNTTLNNPSKIWAASNPRGAERLPPGIVAAESDLYPRRLWGMPDEDLKIKPKYLVAFTVGYDQRNHIDASVKKFSENFTIVLFHYDGRVNEWSDFEWSKRAIHVSIPKQTKWWYAKRFLHPDIVAPYDYIFIWDEDLGVEHFNAEEYINLVRKHGLEISQPGLDPESRLTWEMTIRRPECEVHTKTSKQPNWCPAGLNRPPCSGFVEIMAPVFSRDAWRCVWHMIQNDLVHGWGLDFALGTCIDIPHQKIGVVDAQWILHKAVPSLGNQGEAENGKAGWKGVRERCISEWDIFKSKLTNAEKAYYKELGINSYNSTTAY